MASKLEPPETHYLQAALGWLELGNPREAAAELARLRPEVRQEPEVLEASWRLYAAERRWEDALAVARTLTLVRPEDLTGWVNQSFALHELRRTAEALALLRPKAAEFPREGIIPYNLACYACQLGDLGEARRWLGRFLQLRDKEELLRLALSDPDLQPLWDELRTW